MSLVSTAGLRVPPSPDPEPDPYRYGWRYVTVAGPDGTETIDQIPLTLEDVLFPEVGDFIVQTDAHDWDAMDLS
jgi:colicin import membrane protein